ncbi:hypothetical protein Thiowin_04622 [Thiorhodovibrio winogradskyi]|uniref:Uncharacterized protein n=1 Tax=Thiorhodovibrio winogradskyi TaxID=77007 RepID=A0ABZ0SEN9_9GAMM
MIDPGRYSVEVFRNNQDGCFVLYPCGAGEPVTLTSLDVTLAMADLHEDFQLSDCPAQKRQRTGGLNSSCPRSV